MSNAYTGEIRIFGFSFAPRNWAFCDGQLIPISQNSALFSILGTVYGGNGTTTFALPNLKDRAAMDWGNGPGLTSRSIGEPLGSETVTLTQQEIPGHNHMLVTAAAISADDSTDTPTSAAWLGQSLGSQMYTDNTAAPETPFAPNAISNNGGSQPHNNMQPLLTMNFCICQYGIFPSRN